MKRKKVPQHCRTHPAPTDRERAYEDVQELISGLSAELPNVEAAQNLVQLTSEMIDALCHYLEHSQDVAGSLPGEPPWHPVVASKLAEAAIRIAVATLTYAGHHPERLGGILAETLEWPAIISLDPTRDIRKVERNPDGAAARFYAPVLEVMGRNALFPAPNTRQYGIFHRIAAAAAESIQRLPGWTVPFRLRGLPWCLDYVDPHRAYTLRSNHDQTGDNREWAIALKYLLHLTLSPEPFRSALRIAWRASRVEAFKTFKPSNSKEAEWYNELLVSAPLPSPNRSEDSKSDEFFLPALLIGGTGDENVSSKPIWAWWWEDTLKYEPDALFGHLKPLTEWSDPAVIKLTRAKAVQNSTRAAFGRCVDSIIEAFLHLRGVSGGLRAITKTHKPLPRIVPNGMSFGDELRHQAEIAVGLLRSVGE